VKILWSWLLELCDLDKQPTVEEGARALTRGGLEIEGMTEERARELIMTARAPWFAESQG